VKGKDSDLLIRNVSQESLCGEADGGEVAEQGLDQSRSYTE